MLNMRSASDDRTAIARIRDAAIEQWGEHGFNVGLRRIAEVAGVSAALVIHHFGSKENLRKACDDYIAEEIRAADTEALKSMDPSTWFAELANIEEYAPMTAYLVRTMQSGGELAKTLWQRLIDNSAEYLEEAVRAGTIKASRYPEGRAKLLALIGGGSLLLYLQLHDNPTDLAAVLRDYADETMLPALELYTQGLMADSTMFDAFVAQQEKGIPFTTTHEGDDHDRHVPGAG
ncbi:MAG TPA: TetR family transcriptional regulator [Mycobacterium sp.]|nr:TetR family transcriptional regulator [Mycobacterium sp.]